MAAAGQVGGGFLRRKESRLSAPFALLRVTFRAFSQGAPADAAAVDDQDAVAPGSPGKKWTPAGKPTGLSRGGP